MCTLKKWRVHASEFIRGRKRPAGRLGRGRALLVSAEKTLRVFNGEDDRETMALRSSGFVTFLGN